MPEILTFGDIFFYSPDGEEYVYLALGESGTIYAARILGVLKSNVITKSREEAVVKNGEKRTREKPVYCFVQLQTEGYTKRVAHLNRPGEDKNQEAILTAPGDVICYEDMISIRDEILSGPVPLELKEQVGSLDFESLREKDK